MMFQIRVSTVKDVAVLGLAGELSDLPGGAEFHEAIDAQLAEGRRKFLINCEKLLLVNSSGVGFFVIALSRVKKASGYMKLCGLSPRVQSIFDVSRLYTTFDIAGSCEDALSSF